MSIKHGVIVAGFVLTSLITGSAAQELPSLRDAPAGPDLIAQAQSAMDAGNLNLAADLLKQVLDKNPLLKNPRLVLVDLLMRLGRGEEAGNQADTARLQFPNDPQVLLVGAAVAFHRAQFEESEKLASEVIKASPDNSEAYRIRAFSRFMLENYDGYISDLKSLLEHDPTNADAYYHLGRWYYENQQFTEGLAELEKATQLDPTHYKALYFLGWCQQAQGNLEAAKESYRKSIQVIQERKVAYGWPFSDLGDLLITEGDYDSGLGWLYQGVRNDPNLPYSRYKYATALMKEAPTGEVEIELLAAVKLDPGYTEAFYLLGRYYQAVGEKDKSKQAFARFQELRQNPEASPFGVKRGR
jgi:tetratricopeptide (TPR) repeat protein